MPINSLLYPSNVFVPGVYDVANSCRFNSGSSDKLVLADGTPTDALKWTYSTWVKRSALGASGALLGGYADGNNWTDFYFSGTNNLELTAYIGASVGITVNTNAVFRDVSAWYHIVLVYDSANGTESNRVKIYVNGVLQTINTATYPSQNYATKINASGVNQNISFSAQAGFNGYLAETVFIDGQALDPTSFGEFDEDSGIWKPIDVSGLTFGTNGFYLDFEDSAALGDDVSGNGNDFTVNNLTAIDQSTDTCTNNFATLNVLARTTKGTVPTMSNGNLTGINSSDASSNGGIPSTIASNSGKFYWEAKVVNNNYGVFGITLASNNADTDTYGGIQNLTGSYAIFGNSGRKFVNGTGSADSFTFSTDDILMCALDLDNNYVYFGKNDTWYNSGDPTSGGSGTNAFSSFTNNYYLPFMANNEGNYASGFSFNFGNAPYTISSGNTDGNGYGNFEYAPPSGYYALCAKNLSEFG